jgi:hypothetical protein
VVQTFLIGVAGVVLFLAGYTVAARDRLAEWWSGAPRPAAATTALVRPLTVPAEAALNRARQALAARRYEEARQALALVPMSDPLRGQADALLAELQQALGAATSSAAAPSGATTGAPRP